MSGYCLDYKDDETRHLCTNDFCRDHKNLKSGHEYVETIFDTMEELLGYALNMNENVEIPKGYKATKIYSIVFSTGNFDPKDKSISTVDSSIFYSSKDKTFIEKMFDKYVEGKEESFTKASTYFHTRHNSRKHKYWYCWHTEDFAYNQVIHSYSIRESYLIEKED